MTDVGSSGSFSRKFIDAPPALSPGGNRSTCAAARPAHFGLGSAGRVSLQFQVEQEGTRRSASRHPPRRTDRPFRTCLAGQRGPARASLAARRPPRRGARPGHHRRRHRGRRPAARSGRQINPGTYIGRGKLQELQELVQATDADVVIFDNDLSPAQIRNIEKATNVKVLDRSELILDIFATRARTPRPACKWNWRSWSIRCRGCDRCGPTLAASRAASACAAPARRNSKRTAASSICASAT